MPIRLQPTPCGHRMESAAHPELKKREQNVPAAFPNYPDDAHLAGRFSPDRFGLSDLMVIQAKLPKAEKNSVRVRPNRVDSPHFQCEVSNQFA